MKNTPFIQELVEARMYRGNSTLKGKSAEEIAHISSAPLWYFSSFNIHFLLFLKKGQAASGFPFDSVLDISRTYKPFASLTLLRFAYKNTLVKWKGNAKFKSVLC